MVHNLLSFRVRCALLSEVITEIDRYRVEVSGRDEEEIFFVENLSWLGTNSRASMFLCDTCCRMVPWYSCASCNPSPHRRFIDLSDLPEHLQHRPARLAGDEDWQPLSLDEVCKTLSGMATTRLPERSTSGAAA